MPSAIPELPRRDFLQRCLASGIGLLPVPRVFTPEKSMSRPPGRYSGQRPHSSPPSRVITHEDGFFWFGYYDKLQFSPENRFVLSNRVRFQHRSPTAADMIEVGMVDLEDQDRWIPLGRSNAWNWQQGCMLQWLPGSDSKVIWNDRIKDRFVSHILDVKTNERNTLPHPVYAIAPNGREAVSCDFARIGDCRPGYGYTGIADRFPDQMAPAETGITQVNLETGESKLLISHEQLARLGEAVNDTPESKHHAYHLLYNPTGERFILLHRWGVPKQNFLTRLITADRSGQDLRIVIPNGYASHFIWRDADHILAQSRGWRGNLNWGNFLFADQPEGILSEIGRGVLDPSGHFSYLRQQQWILSDTYPRGPERLQTPHLYDLANNRRIDLGHFPAPEEYRGEWRVDTHPRLSRDERLVCLDAPHPDRGRQLYLIEIGEVT